METSIKANTVSDVTTEKKQWRRRSFTDAFKAEGVKRVMTGHRSFISSCRRRA